jgi:2-dehydropantoate 2-reductase
MNILVIGAGAVGGYFGGRLAQAGRDVTFLVRPARAASIRKDGLRIVSQYGDATLQPTLVTSAEISKPYDLILLSVKAYGLETAIEDFAPAVGKETMIFPALNGMRHMDLLISRFGEKAVIGGVCRVSTEIDNDGRIIQLADFQKLVYGERSGELSDRMQALDSALQGAGFDVELSTGIVQAMWDKWLQLSSLGAMTCLLRGNVGEIEATPGGSEIALQIIRECHHVIAACGFPAAEGFLKQVQTNFTKPGSKLASSMYRDMTGGRPVEADQILGDLLARGSKLGVATPLLQAAYVNLSIYQAGLAR